MRDINGMILKVGDSVMTTQGVVEIQALIAPDNDRHQGKLVRVKDRKGHKTDIRLLLSMAEYRVGEATGFKLGDMVRLSLKE